jgi:probable rRNA maturation factor
VAEPPSPTLTTFTDEVVVVGADEQDEIDVDVDRWARLARAVLQTEHRRGELTLTFVDRDEMAELNAEHLAKTGPTDVLSFPLDDDEAAGGSSQRGIPVLLGDVVVCPAVAAEQAATHAGTLDDELALLVVHGVLHVLGHDHATMRARELDLLRQHHWAGPPPPAFRQDQDS